MKAIHTKFTEIVYKPSTVHDPNSSRISGEKEAQQGWTVNTHHQGGTQYLSNSLTSG